MYRVIDGIVLAVSVRHLIANNSRWLYTTKRSQRGDYSTLWSTTSRQKTFQREKLAPISQMSASSTPNSSSSSSFSSSSSPSSGSCSSLPSSIWSSYSLNCCFYFFGWLVGWLVGWFPPLGFSLSPFFFIFQIQCLAGFIQSALGINQNGHRNSATSLISLIRPELHRPFSLEISLQWSTSSRNVSQKMRRKQYSRRNSRAKRRLHRPQL